MSTPIDFIQPHRQYTRPTLRAITVAALVINGLYFVPDLVTSGSNGLNLGHIIPALIVAALVAWRPRWTPALGALWSGLMLVDGAVFLTPLLTAPDTAATFAW